MSTAVVALIAVSVGAGLGFMLCASFTAGKVADLQQKLIDRGIDPF